MNMVFYVILLAIPILLMSLTSQSVNAQSENFKTYANKDFNFTIQHPSKWKADDRDEGVYFEIRENPDDKFEFGDLSIPRSSYFHIRVEKLEPQLDYNTMTLQNSTLEQIVQGRLDSQVLDWNSETLIRKNQVTVGGNDGVKIELTSNQNDKDYYDFDIFTIADGKLYTLTYHEKPLKVPETLPLANKMVQSFKVDTEEDTSDTSHFEKENKNPSNNLTYEEFEKKYCAPTTLLLCRDPSEPEEPQDDSNR
jgi:hypothetical protein